MNELSIFTRVTQVRYGRVNLISDNEIKLSFLEWSGWMMVKGAAVGWDESFLNNSVISSGRDLCLCLYLCANKHEQTVAGYFFAMTV